MQVYSILNRPPKNYKIFTQPSQTIPDQSMTIREILDRHAHGLPIGGGREPIFEEENEPTNGINPRTLDLVDVQRMQLENAELIQELDKRHKSEKAYEDKIKAEREALKKQQEDEFNEWKKQQNQPVGH